MAMANTIEPATVEQGLKNWLIGRYPGSGDLEITDLEVPATSGMSNDTVLFSVRRAGAADRQPLVARIQPRGPGVFFSYDLQREYQVMKTLAECTAIPVPTVHWFEPDPGPLGAPFLIMDRVDGRIAADDPPFTVAGWLTELTAEQRSTVHDNGLRTLAEIHAVDWRALELGFLDRPELGETAVAQTFSHYERAYAWAARGLRYPTVEAGFERLRDMMPSDEPTVLCHGDARLANFVFPEDLSVAGVLDWELTTLASPEFDLGWWLFVMRHYTEGIGVPVPEGFPSRAQTIARYEQFSGHTVRNIDFYEALGALFLSFTMIQVANVLTDAGLLPPGNTMAESNPASHLLASLLGLPAPTGTSSTFIGQR